MLIIIKERNVEDIENIEVIMERTKPAADRDEKRTTTSITDCHFVPTKYKT